MVSKSPRYNLAVALRYGGEEVAHGGPPRVALSSDGSLADEIVALARRFGIPVVEEGRVARALRSVPVEGVIPEPLYEAVAVILDKLECLNPASAVPGRILQGRQAVTR